MNKKGRFMFKAHKVGTIVQALSLSDEFSHIQLWAECNGLIINFDKTKSSYFIVLTLSSTDTHSYLRVFNVCILLNCLESSFSLVLASLIIWMLF